MNETFICGDYEALVSYLYDECAPNERRAISGHVAICSDCAEELVALGATREQLAMWTPPDAQLLRARATTLRWRLETGAPAWRG